MRVLHTMGTVVAVMWALASRNSHKARLPNIKCVTNCKLIYIRSACMKIFSDPLGPLLHYQLY